MKNQHASSFVCTILLFTIVALAGCISSSKNSPAMTSISSTLSSFEQSTVTLTPSPVQTKTRKPELIFPLTPTPLPTLNEFSFTS